MGFQGRFATMCGIAIAALNAFTALGATPGGTAGIEETVRMVEGVRLEIRSNSALPVRGKYLIALNYMPNHMDQTPPYRSLMLTVDGNGRIDLLRGFSSSDLRVFVTDLKPQPDGLYSYALNRARPPNWIYSLRLLDPKTGADVTPPDTYPTGDSELDGHETITYVGDRRLFLFYRARKEGDRDYTDMEIQAISSKTGQIVGKWSSRNQFPPEMKGDYLHFNSLFPISDDRVLASARTTSTLYIINLTTGKIEDKIDSKSWKVIDDPMNGFAFQAYGEVSREWQPGSLRQSGRIGREPSLESSGICRRLEGTYAQAGLGASRRGFDALSNGLGLHSNDRCGPGPRRLGRLSENERLLRGQDGKLSGFYPGHQGQGAGIRVTCSMRLAYFPRVSRALIS